MSGNRVRVRDFVAALYDGLDGFINIRMLSSNAPVEQAFVRVEDVAGLTAFVLPRRDRQNAYLGVALRLSDHDGSLKNCGALPALFADLDFETLPEEDARTALSRALLRPSAIVHSGGGLHPWWFLKEPIDLQTDAELARTMLRRLAYALHADLASAEPARILRLPNTFNYKYTPRRLVRVETFAPDRRYTVTDFDDWLPVEPRETPRLLSGPTPDSIPRGQRNNHLTSLAGTMRRRGMAPDAIAAALLVENGKRCRPPLADAEVHRIAASVGRYAPDTPVATPPEPRHRKKAKEKDVAGRLLKLEDPEPWPDAVSGEQLLTAITALLCAFVVFVDPAHADALALWLAHTYAMDAWWISPLAVVNSPTMRCGKSIVLQLAAHLASRGLLASNISPAALFRTIERYRPTLLLDEAETFLKDNEELRGLVNAGHTRKTAVVIRTVGEQHEAAVFSTWCPKFIALIGRLPATLMDRAVIIPMRRKTGGESVTPLRLDRIEARCLPLRRQMVRWAADYAAALQEADPTVPGELDDRAADNWRPLLAVAEVAGTTWAERGRQAAVQISGARATTEESTALALLRDTRVVFDALEKTVTEVTSAQLVEHLNQLDERPWADRRDGKGITPAWFASQMRAFGVVPGGPHWVAIDGTKKQRRGYCRSNFADAWNRYLEGIQTVTCHNANNDGPQVPFQGVTDPDECYTLKSEISPITTGLCDGVTVSTPGDGGAATVRERVRL
jgi:Protein of unknown function (DUF3631)/Primase C terminal 1 (PriCT-1)